MGIEIHAKKQRDGSFLYRQFTTITDTYMTPPLSKDEFFLYHAYTRALNNGFASESYGVVTLTRMLKKAEEENLPKWQTQMGDKLTVGRKAFLEEIVELLNTPLIFHSEDHLEYMRNFMKAQPDMGGHLHKEHIKNSEEMLRVVSENIRHLKKNKK